MEAFQLRLWDGRIGRWLSPDPYGEFHSPYLGMGNNPISGIDPDGGWKTKFGAWFNNIWTGGQGEVFQSERGDWGLKYPGKVIDGVITIYSPRFGGTRYGSIGAQITEFKPNFFGRIQENILNSNPNDGFLKSSLKTIGTIPYNILDDATVYYSRNFTKNGARHLNGFGAYPKEVLNSGLNTIMLITPSPIKGTFSMDIGFIPKLVPQVRGAVTKYTNIVIGQIHRGNFITATKSISNEINKK